MTPMEAIDHLSNSTYDLVIRVNAGRELTKAQFAEALPKFLDGLQANMSGEAYERFQDEFIREYEAREVKQ